MREGCAFIVRQGFHLPSFAFWTPEHFHWSKAEDIIVRGSGKLVVRLYNSTPGYRAGRKASSVTSQTAT
jgi:D-lyxose ketol-isomerase